MLGFLAAQLLSAAHFGQFSAAFMVLTLLWGSWRAFFIEPFILRQVERAQRITAARLLAKQMLLPVMLICLVCLVLLSPFIASAILGPVIILLLAPVVLSVFDVLRASYLSTRQPHYAAMLAILWSLSFCLAVTLAYFANVLNLLVLSTSYLVTACAVTIAGFSAGRSTVTATNGNPVAQDSLSSSHGWVFLADYLLTGATPHALFFALVVVSGWQESAGLRGAFLLCGALTTLVAGLRLGFLADANEYGTSPVTAVRLNYLLRNATVLALLTSALLLVTWWVAERWGHVILGDTWDYTRSAVIPFGLATLMSAYQLVAVSLLRARGLKRRLLKLSVSNAILYLGLGTVGACLGGATGTCWGMFVASVFSAIMFVVAAARA